MVARVDLERIRFLYEKRMGSLLALLKVMGNPSCAESNGFVDLSGVWLPSRHQSFRFLKTSEHSSLGQVIEKKNYRPLIHNHDEPREQLRLVYLPN
jgi:hypothetical protein